MIVEGENPPMDILGGGGAASEVDLAVARLVVPEIPNGVGATWNIATSKDLMTLA